MAPDGTATAAINLAEIQRPIQGRLDLVQDELRRMVAADFGLITEVNSHLLRLRGKQFRPTLLLLAEAATGPATTRAVSLGAIIELIHLATLVHDDSVDHSPTRRGMPTVNGLFSHQVAVIMGDYLYSRAMIELVRLDDLDPLRVLARVTNEMTVGEMRQLLSHDPLHFTEADYDLLIRSKTASLLSAACECGALGAAPAERAALASFGQLLGMAYQIVDDLLDYTADEQTTGKPSGLDLKGQKATLPLLAALPNMEPGERQAVQDLMHAAAPTDAQVAEVVAIVERRGGLAYARERGARIAQQAEADLDRLRPGPAREALRACLAYVLERRR
ncbi:MAG: polyprenyl synthetase family protein [Gemmatimonadales bacterium]|nr:polyprenyl synthetase family protein [Gemmatimonadales bacterium]